MTAKSFAPNTLCSILMMEISRSLRTRQCDCKKLVQCMSSFSNWTWKVKGRTAKLRNRWKQTIVFCSLPLTLLLMEHLERTHSTEYYNMALLIIVQLFNFSVYMLEKVVKKFLSFFYSASMKRNIKKNSHKDVISKAQFLCSVMEQVGGVGGRYVIIVKFNSAWWIKQMKH